MIKQENFAERPIRDATALLPAIDEMTSSLRYSVLLAFLLLAVWPSFAQTEHPAYSLMVRAAQKEIAAEREIYTQKIVFGIFDPTLDPNRTGMVGVEFSPITSTVGYLKAKRAAANPDFAAFIVRTLVDHSIGPDDSVVVCMTGSFPGLNLAVLMALEVLDVRSLRICSIGASSYGANQVEMTWIDMENDLERAGLLKRRSDFVTLGATGDIGHGLSREARDLIRNKAFALNYPLLKARSLKKQTKLRLSQIGDLHQYKLLINIGGNHAMLGNGPDGRQLPGGWNNPSEFDWSSFHKDELNGIVFDFLRAGIPVLNLLHIEDIAHESGLPFDPETLSEPGQAPVYFLGLTSAEETK